MLAVVSLAQFLGMTLWFSATAVTPLLIDHFQIAPSHAAWLTMAVQAGFVAGTLLSALSNIADLLNARVLMCIGSVVGAAANAAVLIAPGGASVIALRFITGASLALVYPLAALPSKTEAFSGKPTLNGLSHLEVREPWEFDALTWLSQRPTKNEVVLEASGGQYSFYGRASTVSGIPSVLGWAGHEVQWRGNDPTFKQRLDDIEPVAVAEPHVDHGEGRRRFVDMDDAVMHAVASSHVEAAGFHRARQPVA